MASVLALTSATSVMVFDADSLGERSYRLYEDTFEIGMGPNDEQSLLIGRDGIALGWIRRLAPPDWQRGLIVDSHVAAVKSAWLALLVAVIRTCRVNWLTDFDDLIVAENKLVQAAAARRLGIPTPDSIVCSDSDAARAALGDEIVLKPLGVGHYYEGDTPLVVYSTAVDVDGEELAALGTAPFLAQRLLRARRHLRIVTVKDRVWVAGLDAASVPLDWRQQPSAHRSFMSGDVPNEAKEGAQKLARELRLGYSSQDWIICDDGCYVVDVNPGGQWLFLPQPIATEISGAICSWLTGDTYDQ